MKFIHTHTGKDNEENLINLENVNYIRFSPTEKTIEIVFIVEKIVILEATEKQFIELKSRLK